MTHATDAFREDGTDVHDLELPVGLAEVLSLADRVGYLTAMK